ncbi:hypothetical protein [Jiangella alba]|uniref:hypothetical protein n=1 Tax=Jiangella alba TaxID=561176 RepID=UPI00083F4FAD|nr:hypothetical protein [Jiangella alba]
MTLGAYILPSSLSGCLLDYLLVSDAGGPVTDRPLSYGAPLPDGADAELFDLGYARLDAWTATGGGWHCTVEPHI